MAALKCRFGAHEWEGCRCARCRKARDKAHDWSKDCESCLKCHKVRSSPHKWKGCKCTICGKIRDEEHDWTKNCQRCSGCGRTRDNQHQWNGLACSKCKEHRYGISGIERLWPQIEAALGNSPGKNLELAKESRLTFRKAFPAPSYNFVILWLGAGCGASDLGAMKHFESALSHAIALDIQDHGEISMAEIAQCLSSSISRPFELWYGCNDKFSDEAVAMFYCFHWLLRHNSRDCYNWWRRLIQESPRSSMFAVANGAMGILCFEEMVGLSTLARVLGRGEPGLRSIATADVPGILQYYISAGEQRIDEVGHRQEMNWIGKTRPIRTLRFLEIVANGHLDLAISSASAEEEALLPIWKNVKQQVARLVNA